MSQSVIDSDIALLKETPESMSTTLTNAMQSLEDLESKGMGDSAIAKRISGLVEALKTKEAGMSQSIRVLENGKRKLAVAKRESEKNSVKANVIDDVSTEDENRSILFEQELLSFKSDCLTNSKQVLERGNLLKARLAAAKSGINGEKSEQNEKSEISEETTPEIKPEIKSENKHIHFNESVKVKTFKKPESQAVSELQKAVNDIKENIEKMEDMLKDMEKIGMGDSETAEKVKSMLVDSKQKYAKFAAKLPISKTMESQVSLTKNSETDAEFPAESSAESQSSAESPSEITETPLQALSSEKSTAPKLPKNTNNTQNCESSGRATIDVVREKIESVEKDIIDIEENLEKAKAMIITMNNQGLGDSPVVANLKDTVASLTVQRERMLDSLIKIEQFAQEVERKDQVRSKRQERVKEANIKWEVEIGNNEVEAAEKIENTEKSGIASELSENAEKAENNKKSTPSLNPVEKFQKLVQILAEHSTKLPQTSVTPATPSIFQTKPERPPIPSILNNKPDHLESLELEINRMTNHLNSERQKLAAEKISENLELRNRNSLAIQTVKTDVEAISNLQTHQHDRVNQCYSILNDHGERLAGLESGMRGINQELRMTSLNRMSEEVFSKLLHSHKERPSFVFELFELVEGVRTDENRDRVLVMLRNMKKEEESQI